MGIQPGALHSNKAIGALHSKEGNKVKTRYCSRCEDLFQIRALLGPRILGIGESKPADYEGWLQLSNCSQLYAKREVKTEPELSPIIEPSNGKQGKVEGIEKEDRKRSKGRGSNARLKANRWQITDEELKSGSVLLAYSSTDLTEPIV
jgi:hypothetical protein